MLQKHDRHYWAGRLQRLEPFFVSKKRNTAQFAWAEKQNEEVDKLFSLLQREIYLKEELRALEKLQSLTQDEKMRIKGLEDELKTFDKQYWLQKRAYHKENLRAL